MRLLLTEEIDAIYDYLEAEQRQMKAANGR